MAQAVNFLKLKKHIIFILLLRRLHLCALQLRLVAVAAGPLHIIAILFCCRPGTVTCTLRWPGGRIDDMSGKFCAGCMHALDST